MTPSGIKPATFRLVAHARIRTNYTLSMANYSEKDVDEKNRIGGGVSMDWIDMA